MVVEQRTGPQVGLGTVQYIRIYDIHIKVKVPVLNVLYCTVSSPSLAPSFPDFNGRHQSPTPPFSCSIACRYKSLACSS